MGVVGTQRVALGRYECGPLALERQTDGEAGRVGLGLKPKLRKGGHSIGLIANAENLSG